MRRALAIALPCLGLTAGLVAGFVAALMVVADHVLGDHDPLEDDALELWDLAPPRAVPPRL